MNAEDVIRDYLGKIEVEEGGDAGKHIVKVDFMLPRFGIVRFYAGSVIE